MTTASDYDARRVSDPDAGDGAALRDLGSSLPGMSTAVVDEDPNDVPFFELPDGDLTGEELSVAVVPKRADEFTCSCCFWCSTAAACAARRTGALSAPTAAEVPWPAA